MSTPDPDPGSGTSLSMLQRMRVDDSTACQRFLHLYGPLVRSWLRRSGFHDADAADLAQDVFLAVSRAIGRFERRADGKFRAWLSVITSNRVREHYRSQQGEAVAAGGTEAHLRLLEMAEQEPDDPGSTDCLLHRGLELVRGDFEDRTWQAFWRCTVEGHDTAEVAADLGLSLDAIYKAKARVLRRLREELGDLLDDAMD